MPATVAVAPRAVRAGPAIVRGAAGASSAVATVIALFGQASAYETSASRSAGSTLSRHRCFMAVQISM